MPAMSDEAIIVKNQGTIFLGGPPLVKAATGEVVTAEDLGGGDVHTRLSGVADHLAQNDMHALALARTAVKNLYKNKPQSTADIAPAAPKYAADELYGVIPVDTRKPFDVREIIARIVDDSDFDEFKARLRALQANAKKISKLTDVSSRKSIESANRETDLMEIAT